MGMFLDETGIWTVDSVSFPLHCRWAPSNPRRAWIEQRQRKEAFVSSCLIALSWDLHLLPFTLLDLRPLDLDWNLHPRLPWFSHLQTQTELQYQVPWVSSLQLSDCGTSQSLNCMSQFLLINLSLYPVGSVSAENPNTMAVSHYKSCEHKLSCQVSSILCLHHMASWKTSWLFQQQWHSCVP